MSDEKRYTSMYVTVCMYQYTHVVSNKLAIGKATLQGLFTIQCEVTKNRHVLMLLYLELGRLCCLWSMYKE